MKLCSIHRLAGGIWLDDSAHLPAFVRRHLAACPSCRPRYQAERQLAQTLRASAKGHSEIADASGASRLCPIPGTAEARCPPGHRGLIDRQEVQEEPGGLQEPFPPLLKARIVARFKTGSEERREWPSASSRWITATAGVAACLAFLGLIWPRWLDLRPPLHTRDAPNAASTEVVPLRIAWLEGSAVDRLQRWSATLEDPLIGEMASAVADGRRLLASVVQSCVPEPTASVILEQTGEFGRSGPSATPVPP